MPMDIISMTVEQKQRSKGSFQKKSAASVPLVRDNPFSQTLERILSLIAPLNLTDPESSTFSPNGCHTIHDVIRFAHEMALRELFDYERKSHSCRHSRKTLRCGVPMKCLVIDLDGTGMRTDDKTISIEDIQSIPMMAIYQGLTAVPWEGPPR